MKITQTLLNQVKTLANSGKICKEISQELNISKIHISKISKYHNLLKLKQIYTKDMALKMLSENKNYTEIEKVCRMGRRNIK